MRNLTSKDLVCLWENGYEQSPVRQGLLCLAALEPQGSIDTLAELPIGRRDARLLTLRKAVFGSRLECASFCPNCRERVEWVLHIQDILRDVPETDNSKEFPVEIQGYEITLRLPDSNDLLHLTEQTDRSGARRALLKRCVLSAQKDGQAVSLDNIPQSVCMEIIRRMEEADPQARVDLELSCPSCSKSWTTPFDILSYFWRELDVYARRLLQEVHQLASAYGWREDDILSMSARRRGFYLSLVNA